MRVLSLSHCMMLQVDIDFNTQPIGTGKDGKQIFFKDIWPSNEEIARVSFYSIIIAFSGVYSSLDHCFGSSHISPIRLCSLAFFLTCLKQHMKRLLKEIPCGTNYLCLPILSTHGTQLQRTYTSLRILRK